MKLSIIIPVYNEEDTVLQVVEAVRSVVLPSGISKEIVIVNDGSTDRTVEVLGQFASDPVIRIFHQSPNQGKTAAFRRGFQEASGDILLIQDADLEYHPREYPKLLEPFLKDGVDAVYGSRFKGQIRRMEWVNRLANYLATGTLNLFYGTALTDINTCFKVVRSRALKGIEIRSSQFVGDIELTAKLIRSGVRITEVPIDYEARSVKQGKKMDWPKALVLYWGIVYYRFAR
ncbi:MAG: glycosyltransferase family 2 protein [Candidatus Omnitrophica bacterium]|nr:glycosyltransferase family 2 protein [Candidatus Omnitrophota bacterium]